MNAPHENPHEEAIPAATIVIFRRAKDGGPPEMLMVIRSKTMVFAGGMAVFPGGRLDEADRILATSIDHELADDDEAAHRIAAYRETLEETGLAIGVNEPVDAETARAARAMLLEVKEFAPVLDKFGWSLDLNAALPFARWFPKNERVTRVFDTRFYLYDIGTGSVDIAVDETENTRLFWISAQGALDSAEEGDISIIYPTRRNLERLATFADYGAGQADCEAHPVEIVTPFLTEENGEKWLRIGDNHGYPVTGEPLSVAMRG